MLPEHMTRGPTSLREHRGRVSLSQKEVAFLSGLPHSSMLSRYEKALVIPSLPHALAIAYSLNCPVEFLFEELARDVKKQVFLRKLELLRQNKNYN